MRNELKEYYEKETSMKIIEIPQEGRSLFKYSWICGIIIS